MNAFGVLSLAMCEKLINGILSTDELSADKFAPIAGKSLRIIIKQPDLAIDVLFGEARVRFEPVVRSLFEPQGGVIVQADCTLSVDNPKHLFTLMQNPVGNLPIRGDHRVLIHAKSLLEQFEPDVWYQLEQLIGYNATAHLYALAQEALPILTPLSKTLIGSFEQLFGLVAKQSTNRDQLDEQIHAKKQQLLRLQSDIERNQAKLDEITQKILQHSQTP